MNSDKKVTVKIADKDLKLLSSGYNLCVSRMVTDTFDVVCSSSQKLTELNYFTLSNQFKIFCASEFRHGSHVECITSEKGISPGQTIVLNKNGIFGDPKTGGGDKSITLRNDYDEIYPGLGVSSNGGASLPIYVTPGKCGKGRVELVPVDKVLIWFEQDKIGGSISSGSMFSREILFDDEIKARDARSYPYEVDLSEYPKRTVLYKNGDWSLIS